MKFKHIAAVLAGAAALAAPSCSLDEKFYSEVTPDTFFTSPESTYAVLCRPFTHWKWYIGADRWYLQELTTDEMVCPKRGADWYNGGEYYRLHYHTWSPDDRFVVNTYDGTTGGISRALEAKADLEGVDYNAIGLSDAVKADHINQLNAITAYFYMKGLDYFGGMPIYHSVNDGLRPPQYGARNLPARRNAAQKCHSLPGEEIFARSLGGRLHQAGCRCGDAGPALF